MSLARQRVIDAALACFGARGYAGTTIADIERAAGLTPGSGGTYRHFPSKRAILEAVVDNIVATPDEELAPPPTDLATAARASLDFMTDDLVRLFFRELDDLPEQRNRIIDRLVTGPYRIVAERFRAMNPSIDAAATAAVLLGALINFRVIEVLNGPGSNGISREAFINTWVDMHRAYVGDP